MNQTTNDDRTNPELDAQSPRRRPRGSRLWLLLLPLLTLGLVGTGIATAGVAQAQNARAPATSGGGSRLNGILNASGVDLELTSAKTGPDTTAVTPMPGRVNGKGMGESSWATGRYDYVSTWATTAELEATYNVVGTPYEIWIHMTVPPLLPNSIEYRIRLAATHEQLVDSDYLDVRVGYRTIGWDPQPIISVQHIS